MSRRSPVHIIVTARRGESGERLLKRFMKQCKSFGHDRDTTLERYIRAKSPCYGHYDKPSVAKKAKAKEALRRRMREERKKEKRRLRAEQRRDRRSKR